MYVKSSKYSPVVQAFVLFYTKFSNLFGLKPPLFFEFWKSEQRLDPNKVKALTPLIKNFYKSHGFYSTEAKSVIENNTIIFLIKENDPIKIANISTISALNIKDLIPFHKQDRFDLFIKKLLFKNRGGWANIGNLSPSAKGRLKSVL